MPVRLPIALLVAAACALALAACSRMDLAYRNLDRLVPWSLNDYLDMNREQKTLLDERLQTHLAWHCQTQLPGYLDWLDRVRDMVAKNQVTDLALQQRTAEARQAIGRVAEEITPSASELLRGMTDAQVAEMRSAFADDIRERQKEYVDTPLTEQIASRSERMEKRLSGWFGKLNDAQRQRVYAWSQALGDQNRQWIANRQHWQQQLLLAMSQRNDDPKTASRPFDKNRDGFVMGEGAGALILEEYEHAKARGAKIYAELVGAAMTADAYHMTSPHPEGLGAAKSMELAIEEAGLKPKDIDYLNLHATSTPVGDIAELNAVQKVFGNDHQLHVSSTKSMTGHLLGAAAAIEAIIAIKSINENIIPATINVEELDDDIPTDINVVINQPLEKPVKVAMSNAFGFGGHNSTVVFKEFVE